MSMYLDEVSYNEEPENFFFVIPITIGRTRKIGAYEIGLCNENMKCLYYYCFQKKMVFKEITEEKNTMEDVITEQFYNWLCDKRGCWDEVSYDFNEYIGGVYIEDFQYYFNNYIGSVIIRE